MKMPPSGFSLLETLLAIIIFALGALGILLILSKSKADTISQDERLQAAMLLNQATALLAAHQSIQPLIDAAPTLLPEGIMTLAQADPPILVVSWYNHNTHLNETLYYGATP